MKNEKAVIILNGKGFNAVGFRAAIEEKPDLVIAVDGGLKQLEEIETPPVIHIGDMDSSSPDSKVPVKNTIIYPTDKDRSDFYLALDFVYKKNVNDVQVFAACGGRSDHFLSNYDTAVDFASRGMKISFLSEKEDILFLPCIAPENHEFHFPAGSTISIFSVTEECEGVSLEGFKYPLKRQMIHRKTPLGLSNITVEDKQIIDFEKGVIVVIFNKKI